MNIERLVGFDCREMWLEFATEWSIERKQQFLYRLDIVKSLSIDTKVWPSVFAASGKPAPPERFGYQDSWNDLQDLRHSITKLFEHEKLMKPFRIIAITLLLGDYGKSDKVDWTHILPAVTPDRRDDHWKFAGYDVGDMWMLSALSNCGFVEPFDNVEALRRKWGSHLNKFHLFDDVNTAISFKHMSDERLRDDHAPCFVFGIWIIR